jgi:hypothetical protein
MESDASEKRDMASLQGPVEEVGGKLMLRIPLEAGGDQFVECSKGISKIEDGCLVVEIQGWLAGMLRVEAGDLVSIDNADGKLNIRPVNPRPVQ